MKAALLYAMCCSAIMVSNPASADDKAACLSASQQAQNLRDAHKLVEAREQLRACARKECPVVVQKDCVTWLGEVEKSLPTVVVTAKDADGSDLADVRVTVDGNGFLEKLDGSAVPIDPGMHAFHFARSDGATVDRQVLVREGQTDQGIAVVLKRPPAPVASAPAPAPAVVSEPAQKSAPSSGRSSAWRTIGWVLGGVGLVGVGVGTAFGLVTLGDKTNAHCDVANFCDAGPLKNARSSATIADVGLIAGGVLVAGGLTLVIVSPGRAQEGTARVRLAPMVGAVSGFVIGGGW